MAPATPLPPMNVMIDLVETIKARGLDPEGFVSPDLELDNATEVSGQCDSKSVFVAIKGHRTDGHKFLKDAAEHGARVAIVTELPAEIPTGMHLLKVGDSRVALGPLAQSLAGDPSHFLTVAGVTGTNGKTTTAFLLESIFRAAGRRAGLLSTVVNRWAGHEEVAGETTASGSVLARRFTRMREAGVEAVAMEVSSHAIDQRRTDGIRFRAMGLTNVTQDHLDYHDTMEDYAATKASIFVRMYEDSRDAVGVVNMGDPIGVQIAELLDPGLRLTYTELSSGADLSTENMVLSHAGIQLDLDYHGSPIQIDSPMLGRFNAMNCLCATGIALAAGVDEGAIVEGLKRFPGAPGRFEIVEGLPGVKVIVDYAHTPDAVEKLLQNARTFVKNRLIAIVGCGGDRDRTKRPLMGRTAADIAEYVIITSDNPRTEKPEAITDEIMTGIEDHEVSDGRVRVILDRSDAILEAIADAEEGDVIVIAGKGHEDYQIIGEEKIHFDDREVAREAISARVSSV